MNSVEGENITAPGWTQDYLTPDINDKNGKLNITDYNWYDGTPTTSPDGGTWQNVFDFEQFSQTIVGLTVGQTYYFRYYYSPQPIYASSSIIDDNLAIPNVKITGVDGYINPNETEIAFGWYSYYGVLIATSSSIKIEVSSQANSYLAYDGFYLSTTPLDVPVFSMQPASDLVCINDKTSFSVKVEKASYYQWQEKRSGGWNDLVNSGLYSGVSTPQLTITKAILSMNQYQYRCRVSNECCEVYSSPAILTVSQPATPSLSITASIDVVCKNTIVVFTAKPENTGASHHFQWKKNGAAVGSDDITYQDKGLQTGDKVSCRLTTDNTCVTNSTAISNVITITVQDPVIPSIEIFKPVTSICAGANVVFTSIASNGGTNPQYNWSKNGLAAGNTTASFTDNTLVDKDVIRCTMISDLTCLTSPTAQSNTVQINVNPIITPKINIQSSVQTACSGTPVTFEAIVLNAGIIPQYSWEKNGVVLGKNITYVDSTLTTSDVVTCMLRATGTCLSATEVSSNSISLQIIPNPVIHLNHNPLLCEGENRILNAGQFTSFLWNDSSTGNTLVVNKTGFYAVRVTNANGCSASDTTIIATIVRPPSSFLPPDTSLCIYSSLRLTPFKVYQSYKWSQGSVYPSVLIIQAGLYWLEVQDENHCIGRDSIRIMDKECTKGLVVPTSFTPNGDGKNDVFRPLLFGNIKQYRFEIFDRWGDQIFATSELQKGWNGNNKSDQPLISSTYVWRCAYQFADDAMRVESGTVILLR